jgi:uncharacterized Tic20 family protein
MVDDDRVPPASEHHDPAAARKEYQQDSHRERQERAHQDQPEDAAAAQDRQTRLWSMWIHFSVLAGWAVPLAGIVVPIALWQLKKDELPGIEPHAHIVINWIVNSLLYLLLCFVLFFTIIGIPIAILGIWVLGLATVVFSIVGGIRANDGILWPYPGTFIKLLK